MATTRRLERIGQGTLSGVAANTDTVPAGWKLTCRELWLVCLGAPPLGADLRVDLDAAGGPPGTLLRRDDKVQGFNERIVMNTVLYAGDSLVIASETVGGTWQFCFSAIVLKPV